MDIGRGNVVWKGRTDTQNTGAGLGKNHISLATFGYGWINLLGGGIAPHFYLFAGSGGGMVERPALGQVGGA